MLASDKKYLELVTNAVAVCANYRPKFGQGRKAGLTLAEFQELYESDEFYSWFGLSSPLMYAAHKAAGGMTSVYRQIGIGCQWVFGEILQDHLGLTAEAASWSYSVRSRGKRRRRLSLDGRIPLDQIGDPAARQRVQKWRDAACRDIGLPNPTRQILQGAVFEVRQGYKSKDSKRQNADVANASNAYAHQYLPVVLLLSSQIDGDVAERYQRARWLLLRGTTRGTSLDSAYVFTKEVVGYDLAAFFQRNTAELKRRIEGILQKLLSEN
ncbi:MAG: hypothetical protein ABSA47_01665 [Verrucomicrobiota bacterium]|jgi:hypothetical protein